MHMTKLAASFAVLSLATLVPAQMQLWSTGDGGAVPGKSSFEMRGAAGASYVLLFSHTEKQHEPIPGLKLAVDLDFLGFSLSTAPLIGKLDSSGKRAITIPVPALPGLYGSRLSMQAVEVGATVRASNMIRLTLQKPDTFAKTVTSAAAPLLTGKGFVQSNGKVLFLGGAGPVVQEYDPALEKFRISGLVPTGNILATQTALSDGTILVTGGIGLLGQPVKTAFVFDPATGKSTSLPDMGSARAGHAAARLKDGRVLIVGGAASLDFTNLVKFLGGIQRSSEFYDPKKKTFASGPSMLEQKMFHTATTLGNGEVLVAGGLSVVPLLNVPIVSPTAQAYTPTLNLFGFPKIMSKPRMLHTAITLGNGRALLAGGLTIDFTKWIQTQNLADLSLSSVNDAVTYSGGFFGGFSGSKALSKGRMLPAVAPLGKSGALIAGGFDLKLSTSSFVFQPLKETDYFDGSKAVATGSMQAARVGAVAVTLPDGTVLVTGGGELSGEIYQPK